MSVAPTSAFIRQIRTYFDLHAISFGTACLTIKDQHDDDIKEFVRVVPAFISDSLKWESLDVGVNDNGDYLLTNTVYSDVVVVFNFNKPRVLIKDKSVGAQYPSINLHVGNDDTLEFVLRRALKLFTSLLRLHLNQAEDELRKARALASLFPDDYEENEIDAEIREGTFKATPRK